MADLVMGIREDDPEQENAERKYGENAGNPVEIRGHGQVTGPRS
jgi:hypothetical protein